MRIGSGVPRGGALRIFLKKLDSLSADRGVPCEIVVEGAVLPVVEKAEKPLKDFPRELNGQGYSFPISILDALGAKILDLLKQYEDCSRFVGMLLLHFVNLLTLRTKFRFGEWLYQLEHTGARAMPIVGLMSFLIGLVTAFQAAVQLRQFGANIFVADLVALAMARELAPLITAILMVGRTTSAFTAEIGTMKVNEELDALKVLNINILDYLVIPRVLSAALAGPLLTAWSLGAGLSGGMMVASLGLDVTPYSFLQEVYGILTLTDLWVGFLKSVLFALAAGLIGCYMGLRTGISADSVGRQTTRAVINALFAVILIDAFVTVLAHAFGW
ncbi:MlaE family ABC transporter permease [Thermodesulforhabdus norvegica]|uniref:MlaE family ABC transporter permease n=1 Tax=Thermodesulforhabdus norvegica TaxID=39841 RepID=UPI0015A71F3F|nr:ABC transporter permease [Thermodesulforhabdus norvegica]